MTESPPRRPSIVAPAAIRALPPVPGLEAWREGRARQRRLYSVVQPTDKRALHRQFQWVDALLCFGNQPDAHERSARFARLEKALAEATHPVARQNVIFLAAVSLPHADAALLLEPLARGDEREDKEDALGALAFSGDAGAWSRYRGLAPTSADVHRLADDPRVLEALVTKDPHAARRVLRSYRLIETLDRDLYFDYQTMEAPHDWLPPPDPSDATAERLLREWLDRYPGHPGGDDMAWRLGWIDVRRGDFLGAARWFSKSSTMPDQSVNGHSPRRLLRHCAEFLLDLGQLDTLLNEDGLDTPNRNWLQAILVRRTGAEHGVAEGLRLVAAIAAAYPNSRIARSWRARWSVPAPRGLDSGLESIGTRDPLRRHGPGSVPKMGHEEFARLLEYMGDASRLKPATNADAAFLESMARQFRIWETLAELERRAVRVGGVRAADLRYKQGAILYHEAQHAFLPTYRQGRRRHHYGMSSFGKAVSKEAQAELTRRFVETSFGPLRAIEIWERIEQTAPGYPGLDKAIYSQGLAYRQLLDHEYAPVYSLLDHAAVVRGLVDSFERLAARCPDSTLTPSGAAAARYWRKRAPELFR